MSDTWYYVDSTGSVGPFALKDLKDRLSNYQNARDVLVWRDGFPDWKLAKDVAELEIQTRPAPPPIPERLRHSENEHPTEVQLQRRREVRKRGFFGWTFLLIFFGFNALMGLWLFTYWHQIGNLSFGSDAERTGAAIGATIGTGMILFFWMAGAVITGLLAHLTRGRKLANDIPELSSHPQFDEKSKRKARPGLMAFYLSVGGVIVIILLLSLLGSSQKMDAQKRALIASVNNATPEISIPSGQAAFIDVIESSRTSYKSGSNDLAKGSARPARARALCRIQRQKAVWGWVGRISKLSANSDGKGVLSISIGKDIYLSTWNNSISDIGDHTLLEPNTAIYEKARRLSVGQRLTLYGQLFLSDTDCFRETSLTMSGSMTEPTFLFKFEELIIQ